jgi:hypothetical protein
VGIPVGHGSSASWCPAVSEGQGSWRSVDPVLMWGSHVARGARIPVMRGSGAELGPDEWSSSSAGLRRQGLGRPAVLLLDPGVEKASTI